MPRPTEHHKRFERLTGRFVGDETLYPSPWDPQGGKATACWSSRLDLDGLFLICDYEQERNGKVTFRGHGVYGFDAQRGQYTMYWFDSLTPGSIETTFGKWEGDQLLFERRDARGWNRYVYRLSGDGYTFSILNSVDGIEWTPFHEGTFRRV